MTIEHPDHGGRVRLELLDVQAKQSASYAVTLFIASARWDTVASLELAPSEAGPAPQPRCGAWTASEGASGDPPAWLVRYASSMLAVLQRDHRDAERARWPRRILRWRAERG
jgi:hypothetical protein